MMDAEEATVRARMLRLHGHDRVELRDGALLVPQREQLLRKDRSRIGLGQRQTLRDSERFHGTGCIAEIISPQLRKTLANLPDASPRSGVDESMRERCERSRQTRKLTPGRAQAHERFERALVDRAVL